MPNVTITGSVNEKGNALPFANVYLSDANGRVLTNPIGTTTNIAGQYKLEIPILIANAASGSVFFPPSRYLTVSFVGYTKQTKVITSNTQQYNFDLEPSTTQLAEVEIVADKPKTETAPAEATATMKLEQTKKDPAPKKKKIKTSTIVVASVSGLLVLIIIIWAFNVKSN